MGNLRPVLHDVVEPRAHEPADEPREDHLVRPVPRPAQLAEPPGNHGAGGQEPDAEADAERLERDWAYVEVRKHALTANS